MLDFIIYTISFFITIPLIASLLVYVVSMIIRRNKLKAIHRTVNWTTIFYIIAVTIMLSLIFDRSFIGLVIILHLTMMVIIIFIQWKTKRDVEITRATKLLWRISFLLFFILYNCLMLVGILQLLLTWGRIDEIHWEVMYNTTSTDWVKGVEIDAYQRGKYKKWRSVDCWL